LETLRNIGLSDIGSFASIISLVLTVIVFFNLRSIKRFYVFKARAPELLNKLIKQASNISSYQSDFLDSRHEIDLEIVQIEINLKSLEKKLPGSLKSSVKRVLKQLKRYDNQDNKPDSLWQFYIDLQKLIAEIHEFQSDLNWER